jgi:hypothetical protein
LNDGDGPRELGGAVLAGAGLTSLIHLTPPSLFGGVDWLQLHLPARQFMVSALREGRLPLWNPHVALGRPFLADIETAVLYPPNLAFVVLDPSVAHALVVAAHAALAIWGMLRLGRYLRFDAPVSWLLGCTFVASQALVSRVQSGQTHYGHAITYLPLLIYLAARTADRLTGRRVLALAGALALQLLSGHPQIAWLTWLGLGAFLAGRIEWRPAGLMHELQGIAGLALAIVAALCLAAPTLLPFLELVLQGNRAARTLESAGAQAMTPFHWSSLAVPNGSARAFYWEYNLYSGLAVLVGGIAGLAGTLRERQTRGLLVMAGAGAAFACGGQTPLFALFYHLVPGASVFRLPARGALLVVAALILGLGLLLSRRTPPRIAAVGLGLGALLAVCLVALYRAFAPSNVTPLALWPRLAWLAATLAALVLAAGARSQGLRVLAWCALLIVLGADVGTAIPSAKAAWQFEVRQQGERPTRDALGRWGLYEPRGAPPRVLIPPELARENSGAVYGWSSVAGYQAVSLARVWRYLHDSLGLTPPAETTFPSPLIYARGPFPWNSMNLVAGLDAGAGRLVARSDPDPRAYVALAARVVNGASDAIALMKAGHEFHRTALIEGEGVLGGATGPGSTRSGAAAARAEILSFSAETISVRTESPASGVLVLAEPWYPGWQARVDGAPAACVPVNAWMRGVPVPAGSHEVVLEYRSRWLARGAGLSAITLLCLVGWALRDARHRTGAESA